jgi:hypothetical protein
VFVEKQSYNGKRGADPPNGKAPSYGRSSKSTLLRAPAANNGDTDQAEAQSRNGQYERGGYAKIPNKLIDLQQLGSREFRVICYALSRRADWRLQAWEIRQRFDWKPKSTRLIFSRLKALGLARLIRTPERGGSYWQVRAALDTDWPLLKVGEFSTRPFRAPREKGRVIYTKTESVNKTESLRKERVVPHKSSGTTNSFAPRVRYPDSEEEMYEMLEQLGIEPNPDYDGRFFDQMDASGWMIRGEPVWDWPAAYEARLEVTTGPQ